jgi:Fe-S cluster assembly scaffold protein SufB
MAELDNLVNALNVIGTDSTPLAREDVAHIVVSGHKAISRREVPGLRIEMDETPGGIAVHVQVDRETKIRNPVHLCFGMLQKSGVQRITLTVTLEEHASASFLAHCFFPSAERVEHVMDASIDIGQGAILRYVEEHHHGPFGGITVTPKAAIRVGPQGRYLSDFALTTGRVGHLNIDTLVEAAAQAVTELTTRVFGHDTDEIRVKERVVLAGEASRGLIKTRMVLEGEASAEVTGITEGSAAGARGHIDCMEVVKDGAIATAIPVVKVHHPLAKITHEAAIGSVDQKQLETLMARGLTPEQAVEMIVSGLLR